MRRMTLAWAIPAAALGCAGQLSNGVVAGRTGVDFRPATPLGLEEYYLVPDSNPLTPEKVALGERLFSDPSLSGDHRIACASCHLPDRAFSDSVPFSRGAFGARTLRNAPSLMNRAYGRAFFWNGRAASLEATVLQPIRNSLEMNLALEAAVARLREDDSYRRAFLRAFSDGVTEPNLARALASYVRTLRSGDAPIDRYLYGDTGSLSPDAVEGLRLFTGRANCVTCHVGPNFTDEQLHNTGVSWGSADPGRFQVTGDDSDRGRFKVPTLRNVALTAPYMHDGSIGTLEEVVEFYSGGGKANPHLDPDVRSLRLTADEKRQLVAFLRSLTGR